MSNNLVVLWTSGDRDVALKMTFMYSLAAQTNGWWKNITLVIWGPSALLAAHDSEIRESLRKMREAGVRVEACGACSSSYGVSEDLAAQGIEVRGMGRPLTEYIEEGREVLTF